MRITFTSVAAIACLVAVCASCSKPKNEVQVAAAPQGELVTAVGCPEAGPQPGCVTIKVKDKVYDLATASPAVDLSKGVGISMRGHVATETTACGLKLTDASVEYLGIQCAPPAPTPPPA